ncbi:MAG: M28 family peptidase [Candidatus Heimdallarchaeota archaeon]
MIDEKRILETLKEISFPRLSGTKFESKACDKVKEMIEKLDFSPKCQEFSFSTFYSRIYPRVTLTLLDWLLFILALNLNLIFNVINLFLIVFFILVLIKITRTPEKVKFRQKYNSQNLYVKIPFDSEKENEDHNIFLFSHLDSKSQKFSIKIRIQLYYCWIFTFPLALLIVIINSYFLTEAFIILFISEIFLLCINITALIILWMNITNNKSPGAIDNASGVSCVLELLHFYSDPLNRPKNYALWFVFTGAEESGTMGVRNFYKIIKNFDREKNYIVNFDSIAKEVILWDHGLLNNKYYKSFNYILENKEIMSLAKKTHRFYIGTYSDGLFLLNKKFKGLGNGDKSNYKYIHSENDNLEKIDINVLKRLCQFYKILLNEIDINLKK